MLLLLQPLWRHRRKRRQWRQRLRLRLWLWLRLLRINISLRHTIVKNAHPALGWAFTLRQKIRKRIGRGWQWVRNGGDFC